MIALISPRRRRGIRVEWLDVDEVTHRWGPNLDARRFLDAAAATGAWCVVDVQPGSSQVEYFVWRVEDGVAERWIWSRFQTFVIANEVEPRGYPRAPRVVRKSYDLIPAPPAATTRRHVDESIAQVVLRDPGWFFFVEKKRRLRAWGVRSREIECKARSILVPRGRQVLYVGLKAGVLRAVRLVEDAHTPGPDDVMKPVLDLSVVLSVTGRSACRRASRLLSNFVRQFILHRQRIRSERAEDFFSDDGNFAAYRNRGHGLMRRRSDFSGAWAIPRC
ncbi:MAG: hypothetical protein AB7K71_19890 [Polyangiaceae bacterium]